MNIKNIINTLTELDKSNLFIVQCGKLNNFKYYVKDVTIPAKRAAITEFLFAGQNIPIPGPYKYDDLEITFREDNYASVRTFLEKWINEIFIQVSNNLVDNIPFDNSLVVTSLNETLNPIMQYEFINTIPKSINSYSYDYNEEAGHTLIKVTFAYSYYIVKGVNDLQINPTSLLPTQLQSQYAQAMTMNIGQTLQKESTMSYQQYVQPKTSNTNLSYQQYLQTNTTNNTLNISGVNGPTGDF